VLVVELRPSREFNPVFGFDAFFTIPPGAAAVEIISDIRGAGDRHGQIVAQIFYAVSMERAGLLGIDVEPAQMKSEIISIHTPDRQIWYPLTANPRLRKTLIFVAVQMRSRQQTEPSLHQSGKIIYEGDLFT
jgi:hypothetical protein